MVHCGVEIAIHIAILQEPIDGSQPEVNSDVVIKDICDLQFARDGLAKIFSRFGPATRIKNSKGSDTYSASLQTGPEAEGNDEHYQDYYIIKCLGHHHEALEQDHPQYNGIKGLTMGQLANPPAPRVAEPLPSPQAKRRYELEDALISLEGDRKLVRLATGPKAAVWLSETGERKLPASVQKAAAWGGKDLLGLLYFDYTAGIKGLSVSLAEGDDASQFLAAMLEDIFPANATLEDVHALRTTPDGLVYRGQGLTSSRSLGASGLLAAAIIYPNVVRSRQNSQLTACRSNLKNIATAMEMWSTDNAGRYPTSLDQLVPDYLRTIPACPAAGTDTYSASLQTGPDAEGNADHYRDYYLVKCLGHNHPGAVEPNYPQYSAIEGLIERPEP